MTDCRKGILVTIAYLALGLCVSSSRFSGRRIAATEGSDPVGRRDLTFVSARGHRRARQTRKEDKNRTVSHAL